MPQHALRDELPAGGWNHVDTRVQRAERVGEALVVGAHRRAAAAEDGRRAAGDPVDGDPRLHRGAARVDGDHVESAVEASRRYPHGAVVGGGFDGRTKERLGQRLDLAVGARDLRPDRIGPMIGEVADCVRAAGICARAGATEPVFQVKGRCPYIRLAASYEEYLQTRSRNFRKSLSRAERAAASNQLVIRELEPEHFPPRQIPAAFLSLNLDRWGADSYYRLPSVEAFVLHLLPDLFAEGRLRAFALMRGERLLALDLCMVGADSLCSWNGGFLAEAARWSPGKLLIAAGIKHAHRMNLAEYDLLRGDEAYKKSWANNTRDILWLEFDRDV